MQWTKNSLRGTGASKHPWVTASTACPGMPSSPASSGAARRGQEPHLPAWPRRTHIPALQGERTSPSTQHPGAEQKCLWWVQGDAPQETSPWTALLPLHSPPETSLTRPKSYPTTHQQKSPAFDRCCSKTVDCFAPHTQAHKCTQSSPRCTRDTLPVTPNRV